MLNGEFQRQRIDLTHIPAVTMFRKILQWTVIGVLIMPILLFTLVMILKVPIKPESELLAIEGMVTSIFEGGVKDVCFRLEGDKNVYYINRGLENGLVLEQLQNQLIGKEVIIKYPEHWFMKKARTIHVSILRSEGKTLYNETT